MLDLGVLQHEDQKDYLELYYLYFLVFIRMSLNWNQSYYHLKHTLSKKNIFCTQWLCYFTKKLLLKCAFFVSLYNIDVNHKSKLSSLQHLEKTEQLEEQVQELESLISSLQQQLKETEQSYEAEIHYLRKRLQAVSESTVPPRYSSAYSFIQQYL